MNWLGSSTASHSTPPMPETSSLVHLGQHVVQAMAELVEQGDHVVVGQQRGLPSRLGEIAHQVRHGRLQPAGVGRSQRARIVVHPGATALAGGGGWSR